MTDSNHPGNHPETPPEDPQPGTTILRNMKWSRAGANTFGWVRRIHDTVRGTTHERPNVIISWNPEAEGTVTYIELACMVVMGDRASPPPGFQPPMFAETYLNAREEVRFKIYGIPILSRVTSLPMAMIYAVAACPENEDVLDFMAHAAGWGSREEVEAEKAARVAVRTLSAESPSTLDLAYQNKFSECNRLVTMKGPQPWSGSISPTGLPDFWETTIPMD